MKQFVNIAEHEYKINKVLHKYNFNILVSEASTESNIEWLNPNKKQIEKEEIDILEIDSIIDSNIESINTNKKENEKEESDS